MGGREGEREGRRGGKGLTRMRGKENRDEEAKDEGWSW